MSLIEITAAASKFSAAFAKKYFVAYE